MKLLFDSDIGPAPLRGKTVAVIGFGSQGRAQAENLRDGGVATIVGLRTGSPSASSAEAAGFEIAAPREAARRADIVAMLVPDEAQRRLFAEELDGVMEDGKTLLFAHGFAVHFGLVRPPAAVDVVMVAPKGPGPMVREEYRRGRGVVMLVAVHQDASGNARKTALAYASAIGGGRSGIFESTFRDECETDLFGEQAVICGGLSHLIEAGFETLVEAGYPPELAYFECLHEAKFTADLIHRRGIAGMRRAISGTARYGDLTRGPRIVGEAVREQMREILAEIRSGRFAREWMDQNRTGAASRPDPPGRSGTDAVGQTGEAIRKLIFREGEGA